MEENTTGSIQEPNLQGQAIEKPIVQTQRRSIFRSIFRTVKRGPSYIISAIILFLILYIVITLKNCLDNTMQIETEAANEMCNDEACIIIEGKYSEGFVSWSVYKQLPFLGFSIGTNADFGEGQDVDIICPVELKQDSFQHILTKINFLYKQDKVNDCSLSPA